MIFPSCQNEKIYFPCGEVHYTVKPSALGNDVDVLFDFEKNSEIFELVVLTDSLKRIGYNLKRLIIPYIPYSRQDRVANPGEPFSLKVFCDLINSLGYQKVEVVDPHSDVTTALLNNVEVTQQHEIFSQYFKDRGNNFYLISPDGGALKKIYKLSMAVKPKGVIECSKNRNTATGAVTGTIVHATDLGGADCYIVDDICDGGATFVGIAKELKKLNAGKIYLMVSHGFFTKGLEVFDGLIDHIYTRKGQVK